MLPALLLALTPNQAQTVEVWRGKPIQGYQYWAVEDTYLDSNDPERNQGGQTILVGGPGKTVLIQFKDLRRLLGDSASITKASLVFTITGGKQAALEDSYQLLVPWNEGPVRTLGDLRPADRDAKGNLIEMPERAANWSATWKHRRAGRDPIAWQQNGGTGMADAKRLSDIKLTISGDDKEFATIDGLATALQYQYDNPTENNGLAFQFLQDIEFMSSQGPKSRPKLVLEYQTVKKEEGPDLSVTLISRTPEYNRYDTPSLANNDIQRDVKNGTDKKWPIEGEKVTYTAHIKNVGMAPSEGYTLQWFEREKPGSTQEVAKGLAVGEETTVTFEHSFKNVHSDHRQLPLRLKLTPKGSDARAYNNSLSINENALNLLVRVPKAIYDRAGGRFEEWAQNWVDIVNDAVFPYSRFSFAPDGALERVRIQKIEIADISTEKPLQYDGVWNVSDLAANQIRPILDAAGLVDLSVMTVKGEGRTAEDRFPGLMGGGDTRFEGGLMGRNPMPYEPYFEPLLEYAHLEATDLLAATDVAGLNSNLGRRRGYTGDYLYDVPNTLALTALDYNGRKLLNQKLDFYQIQNGAFPAEPTFSINTGATGATLITGKATGEPAPFQTFTGHTLKPNVFGRINPTGSNAVFMIKANVNGVNETTYLKAWHLVDTFHRGQPELAVMNLRLNLPAQPLESETNMAKARIATDSTNALPAALAPLLDEAFDKEVTLGGTDKDWIDIDLGRDRPLGEVRVYAGENFWPQFDIKVYQTGQKPEEGIMWARELDWRWSIRNRKDLGPGDNASVAYRGNPQRVRFIRILNRSNSLGVLKEIRVVPVRLVQ